MRPKPVLFAGTSPSSLMQLHITDTHEIPMRTEYSVRIGISYRVCETSQQKKKKKKKKKKGKRRVQEVPQSQAATLPRHQEDEERDKTKQAQIERTYEKH